MASQQVRYQPAQAGAMRLRKVTAAAACRRRCSRLPDDRAGLPWLPLPLLAAASCLYSQSDADRAVVATHHIGVNVGGLHLRLQRRRDQYVIDSPPDIALARFRVMAPPGVMAVALAEHAQGVDEAGIDEILEALALLEGEALFAAIRSGVGEIEFGMGDIEIAAEHH